MSSNVPINAIAMTSESHSSLRDLVRKIVRKELQRLRTPVAENAIAPVTEVARDEIHRALSMAGPGAQQRPMSYSAALRRPPPAMPALYRHMPMAPWSPQQEQTLHKPPTLHSYNQPSTATRRASTPGEMLRCPPTQKNRCMAHSGPTSTMLSLRRCRPYCPSLLALRRLRHQEDFIVPGPIPRRRHRKKGLFPGLRPWPSHANDQDRRLIHPTRQDRRADERNCGDTNEPTTDDGAFTIVGIDEKVHDWSDMEDDRFKMDTDEVTWSKEYERLWLKTASARFVG
ncbi:hypothetical protein HPB51_005798 [Rhipicephalus microplus]|uniref:Uncharacterized protein n=1 Tax=Rhipicephalus microplus TaxID=6941 RepID=A0A9J6EFH0_RHIMP|nr:hypothetical protein HPB51_005798 [Rhipicephalus microplus]